MKELDGQSEWRQLLREQRIRLRLSRPEVARRADLSPSAMKAYESGERHPSRGALTAILEALGMPIEQAERVLAGAGYAIDMRSILTDKYAPRPLDWYTEEIERYTWPVFVTNQASDVLAANRAFRLLIGIPLSERLPQPRWNFIARASDPEFAARQENWDESMSFMIGLGKSEQRWEVNVERPSPWTSDAYRQFLEGDPAYITRLLRLWEHAEPVPHTTRMHYRTHWRVSPDRLLRFECTMHAADIWQELSWHDWIPADEETLRIVRTL
jgi:transcriptional regulator with XRE-family HTH domain